MTLIHDTTIESEEKKSSAVFDMTGYDLDATIDSSRKRVFIVDDDPDFVAMTKIILCNAGFDVASAPDGIVALKRCAEVNPDVILLDLLMPEQDGFQTFQKLQKITDAPVIVVTASSNHHHAVQSFQIGVEDFISKPFYNPEMVARIQAVLRRSKAKKEAKNEERTFVFPNIDLMLNMEAHEVNLRSEQIKLLPREFAVLSILAEKAPKPVKYDVITRNLWGEDSDKNRSHLKNVVYSLRQKIEEDPQKPNLIVNYHRFGYQLDTQENRYSNKGTPSRF